MACLDQLLIAITSLSILCNQSRSKTRLIMIINLIAKLGIIYAQPSRTIWVSVVTTAT